MGEIRILTELGETIELKAGDERPVKDLAEEIYRDGFRVTTKTGGRIMRVMAVEYTEDSFSAIVKPSIVRAN